MENAVVLSSCDGWKSYASARILGVFTDFDSLIEAVCKLFKESDIKWKDTDVDTLMYDIKEQFEDYYENPDDYPDNFDINVEIELAFKNREKAILNDIRCSSLKDIHDYSTYIMLEEFELNKLS